MQQALDYAETLDVPFAYSSNGDGFLEHDRLATGGVVERELTLDEFQVYVVEVCRGCGWNHLVEQYLLGRGGLANTDLQAASVSVGGGRAGDHRRASTPSGRRRRGGATE